MLKLFLLLFIVGCSGMEIIGMQNLEIKPENATEKAKNETTSRFFDVDNFIFV